MLAAGTDNDKCGAPLFAELLAIPTVHRYPPLDLAPPKRKQKTLQAEVAQIEGLAARQPVLMVTEDAHWSDPPRWNCLIFSSNGYPLCRSC